MLQLVFELGIGLTAAITTMIKTSSNLFSLHVIGMALAFWLCMPFAVRSMLDAKSTKTNRYEMNNFKYHIDSYK